MPEQVPDGWTQTVDDPEWKRYAHRRQNASVGLEYELDDWSVIAYGRSETRVLKKGLSLAEAKRFAFDWMADHDDPGLFDDLF